MALDTSPISSQVRLPVVRLWNAIGALAIILRKSGVIYTNQVGGASCAKPKEEGFLIPFNDDAPLDQPEGALVKRLSALLENYMYLKDEEADAIDAILASYPDTACARVDRTRLRDSMEAWVYVDIEEPHDSLFQGFGRCKAVLTWPNSD